MREEKERAAAVFAWKTEGRRENGRSAQVLTAT